MRRRKIKMVINNIKISNEKIIDLIKKEKPFIVSRLGIGSETYITYNYNTHNIINKNYYYALSNNAGIYHNNDNNVLEFIKEYDKCLQNSNLLACFKESIQEMQNYFYTKYNIDTIISRTLEPFYIIQENIKPWSHYLVNKKVLIINPFVESFQKQNENGWKMFKNEYIFLPGQKFVYYKSYNTSAGNHIHSSWLETLEIMKNDISKLDFDIALLGCGGYGLPLCNFIKMELNKSAIYVGGGLQLLFGVKGKRWETHPIISKIIKENDNFIPPSGDEILKNNEKIEGGCYW